VTAPGPGRHLDLDVLADVEEELVSPREAMEARAHLEGCGECRARLAQLRTTRALLTALPQDPMPDDVAARLDAALAAAADTSNTIVPLNRRPRFWNTPAIAGVAAAVAILVLVGAVVVGNVSRHHPSTSSSAAGAGAAKAPAGPAGTVKEWSTGTNYSSLSIIAARVPALVLGVPPATTALGGAAPAAPSASPSTSAAPDSVTQKSTTGFTQNDLRAFPAAVVACGRILAGDVATTPVAVDFARFAGKPAVIVVLPAVDHPETQLDVWVVRSTCSASAPDLLFRRVSRPS